VFEPTIDIIVKVTNLIIIKTVV